MNTNTSNLIPFHFESNEIRVITDNTGEPLFVGKDICVALGYSDPTNAVKLHCKGVAKYHPLMTSGGMQDIRVLSEPDVLRLIVNCRLPAGEAFEKLVFEEILPTIRKTGKYEAKQIPEQTPVGISITAKAMIGMAKAFGFKGNQAAIYADRATNKLIGVSPLFLLGADLVAESKEVLLTPTDIGKEIGISNRQVNKLLEMHGYQERICEIWVLTKQGEPYAEVIDTGKRHGEGTPVKQIKWQSRMVDIIRNLISQEAA